MGTSVSNAAILLPPMKFSHYSFVLCRVVSDYYIQDENGQLHIRDYEAFW